MELPDQLTVEELEAKIASYKDRLESLPDPEEHPVLDAVRGGSIRENARGAARVSATGETVHTIPGFIPHVELEYRFPGGKGEILLETTPARLLKVDSNWRREGLVQTGWSERRVVDISSPVARFTFQVPGQKLTIAQPKRGGTETARTYEIPPAATHIRGTGTVKYPTGQEVEIDGEELLKRPGPGGSLTVRPGGVYAIFEGTTPAEVKLGNAWTDTIPTR